MITQSAPGGTERHRLHLPEDHLPAVRDVLSELVRQTGARTGRSTSAWPRSRSSDRHALGARGCRDDVPGSGRCRVNIHRISTSEIRVSCVIDDDAADEAARAVHAPSRSAPRSRSRSERMRCHRRGILLVLLSLACPAAKWSKTNSTTYRRLRRQQPRARRLPAKARRRRLASPSRRAKVSRRRGRRRRPRLRMQRRRTPTVRTRRPRPPRRPVRQRVSRGRGRRVG